MAPTLKTTFSESYNADSRIADPRCNLYDLEDRIGANDKYKEGIATIRTLARSVGCFVLKGDLDKDGTAVNTKFWEGTRKTLQDQLQSQYTSAKSFQINFPDEPCLGLATGFLIGPDLVMTTAHTIFEKDNKLVTLLPTHFIFDYERAKGTSLQFKKDNVYKIECLIAHQYEYNGNTEDTVVSDWALLRLDRTVADREPLTIDFDAQMAVKDHVWMLGHPRGQPMKWSGEAEVTEVSKNFFKSTLAGFAGNSGSPVFSKNSKSVMGIFCQGNSDFEEVNGVVKQKVLNLAEGNKETSFRVQPLTFLRTILGSLNNPLLSTPYLDTYPPGLTIQGHCDKKCAKIIQFYIGSTKDKQIAYPDGSVDIFQVCAQIKECQCECGGTVNATTMRAIVLAKCFYSIHLINHLRQEVIGNFQLRSIATQNCFFQFDRRRWRYLHIKVECQEEKKLESDPDERPPCIEFFWNKCKKPV